MLGGQLIDSLNWIGVFVFALRSALAGAEQRLDLFGVLVLACLTAVAGGVARDLLIGTVPPEPLVDGVLSRSRLSPASWGFSSFAGSSPCDLCTDIRCA